MTLVKQLLGFEHSVIKFLSTNVQYMICEEGHDCRDFILYLCPVGELQAQLSLFWQKSKVMRRSDFVIKNDSYVDKDNDNDRDDNRR